MSRAVLGRALTSVVAFVSIVAGYASLDSNLFILWVGALLLAANALLALATQSGKPCCHAPSDELATSARDDRPDLSTPDPTSSGPSTRETPGGQHRLPVELERELAELQAQLTTLDDQFATELSLRKAL